MKNFHLTRRQTKMNGNCEPKGKEHRHFAFKLLLYVNMNIAWLEKEFRVTAFTLCFSPINVPNDNSGYGTNGWWLQDRKKLFFFFQKISHTRPNTQRQMLTWLVCRLVFIQSICVVCPILPLHYYWFFVAVTSILFNDLWCTTINVAVLRKKWKAKISGRVYCGWCTVFYVILILIASIALCVNNLKYDCD